MRSLSMRGAACAALIYGTLGVAASAYAALGGTPTPPPPGAYSTTVAPVARASSSAVGTTNSASYTVTQTTLASGTIVREYVSKTGTVFGIAWTGPRMPNLPQLLGAYFTQFDSGRNAWRAEHPGRGPLALELPGLVVNSGGHPGAFSGQAYLPQSLPAGVDAADIQ